MTPLQLFFALTGLMLTVAGLLLAYFYPKHRVRQKFFDRALGNSGADGMPQQDDIFTTLERVVHQLNGGGFGAKIADVEDKVDQQGTKLDEHVTRAHQRENEIREDIREVNVNLADMGRVFSLEQQRFEERVIGRIDEIDEKVTGRLTEQTDRAHYLEGVARELLRDDDDA